MNQRPGCSTFWGLICAQTVRCRTLKFRPESNIEDQQACESAGNCGEYQVPVWQCSLRKCSLLDVNQGVYVERLLCCCEPVLQLVHFVDLRCEGRFDTGELVS